MNYRDVLWCFHPENLREGKVRLSVFQDEASFYESSESNPGRGGASVQLPLYKFGWTRVNDDCRWSTHHVSADEAASAGIKLWRALPEEVREPLRAQSEDGVPLRVKIYSPHSRITDLPWELLADEGGNFMALHPGIRLARSVPRRFKTPPLTVSPPLKVLLVLTNPKDEKLLNSYREIEAVKKGLESPDFSWHICYEPTPVKLKEDLHSFLPSVVHYVGHAGISNGEGNIILHDESERTYWVSSSTLSYYLPSSVRLICLSTCFTVPNYQILGLPHLAHSPGELNLPSCVINQYPLDEPAVEAFWTRFYAALIQHKGNINEAVREARLEARAQSDPGSADWASFSLVLRDQTGEALRISAHGEKDLKQRQASELQAQYTARLADELAQQVQFLDEGASKSIRERFETEKQNADDLLKSVE